MNKRIELFTDTNCTIPCSNILEEGKTYYVRLNIESAKERNRILIKDNLLQFLNINPNNKVGQLRIDNRIGFLYIENERYDVRSKHFLHGIDGLQQYQTILNEIRNISKGLSFSYTGATSLTSNVDREDKNPTYFERFNYYRQLVLELPQGRNLVSIVDIIIKNSKKRIFEEKVTTNINSLKKYCPKTIEKFINSRQFTIIEKDSNLSKTHLALLIKKTSGKDIFPYQFDSYKINFSIDNQENRFVKHFIKDINLVAKYILSQQVTNQFIRESANEIVDITWKLLTNSFFIQVGDMQSIPSSSTVLLGRNGYREAYQHYINSRFGLRSILDIIEKGNLKNPLKNISELYEIWAFYKIGEILFKKEIIVSKGNRLFKNGNMTFGFCWEDENYRLLYNYSYTKKSGSSYSLLLRPDFTVIKKSDEPLQKYLLDAKYKGREIDSTMDEFDKELMKFFTSEDIHKMHCYLDAIKEARVAVILYPGDVFRFYERDFGLTQVRKTVTEIENMNGVGAIPLKPNSANFDLPNFLEKITDSI